jgi:hypothetical protein
MKDIKICEYCLCECNENDIVSTGVFGAHYICEKCRGD